MVNRIVFPLLTFSVLLIYIYIYFVTFTDLFTTGVNMSKENTVMMWLNRTYILKLYVVGLPVAFLIMLVCI